MWCSRGAWPIRIWRRSIPCCTNARLVKSRGFTPCPPDFRPKCSENATPASCGGVRPGEAALEPTHVLSNGKYSVALRANGAGWSRWGNLGVSRWRDDLLRDNYGHFFYVQRQSTGRALQSPVSLTQHPAGDPVADYQSTFHADRVCFHTNWEDLGIDTTVWVSPEDDIEFRQVELRNRTSAEIELEVFSAFELTLTDFAADEAHPAFSGHVRQRRLAGKPSGTGLRAQSPHRNRFIGSCSALSGKFQS
jgi:cyclic beta-1,2-glucan synthetase